MPQEEIPRAWLKFNLKNYPRTMKKAEYRALSSWLRRATKIVQREMDNAEYQTDHR